MNGEILFVGNVCPTRTRENPNQGRVYDPRGLCPCLNCGGGRESATIYHREENEK